MKTAKTIGFAGLFFANILAAFAWTYSPTSKEIGVNGGSFTLTVSGTEYYDWNAGVTTWSKGGVIQDTDADWIMVTRVNEKTFSVTVTANNTSDERWAYVTINAFQGGTTHSAQTHVNFQHCSVTQAGQNKPSVDPVAISFPKAGGAVTVDVTAASGDTWKVFESLGWLMASVTSGKGNGRVTLTASENSGHFPRTGTLAIAGKEISVSQEGEPGYSRISYSNLKGAYHTNPSYYKEGEEVVFVDPSSVAGFQFLGWKPAKIETSAVGDVDVEAQWQEMRYEFSVGNVHVEQDSPWAGRLNVTYDVSGDLASWAKNTGHMLTLNVVGVDADAKTRYVAKELSGDLSFSEGRHKIVWDLDAEEVSLNSTNFWVSVSCMTNEAAYCIVDLSSGDSSTNYPVTFATEKPQSWNPTSRLYLRRIAPGSCEMSYSPSYIGLPVTGRIEITQPFYMAVFEMTEDQQQYIIDASKVSGSRLPVADMYSGFESYNPRGNNRGTQWPATDLVDDDSVIGKLRAKTGLKFDLPTCAQWNLACGAGTTSMYFWGGDWDDSGPYVVQNGDHIPTQVGGKLPNPYGLYDMVGNVAEMCLDWFSDRYEDCATNELFGANPRGPSTGFYRTLRGGDCSYSSAFYYGMSYVGPTVYAYANERKGYRLCLLTPELPCTMTLNAVSNCARVNTVDKMIAPKIVYEEKAEDCVVSIGWANSWALFYTLDGSDPYENGTEYEDAIVLKRGGAKNIKAIAIAPDGRSSEVATLEIPAPNAPTISPASGTIIGSSVSVNIASDNLNATIYYTTDGTEPTTDSPVYSRFKASKKMTVKAIAVVDGMAWSETATAEYALGQCADPIITPADGTVFGNSNYQVSIAKNGEKGVLRYTTDGSDPTETSPVYSGPFTISETTTIKAKTFDTDYFDSAVVAATLTRQWTKVATPVIVAPERFSGTKAAVSLTCATEGAVIRYTTDGSVPNSHSPKYTGAFEVTGTTTVKAIALKTDCTTSDVATLTIAKEWCIGDALNDPDRQFVTDVGTGWVRDAEVSHDGAESMKSGAIADSAAMGVYSTSTLSTVVEGKGSVRFLWMASCEEDDEFEWDHGEFRVDGVVVAQINGTSGWKEVSHEIMTSGNHSLAWVYCKDDFGKEGEDCLWLDEVSWTPLQQGVIVPAEITGGKEIVVDESWPASLDAQFGAGTSAAFVEKFGSDLSAALLKPTGKKNAAGEDMYVWQDYVAGTDPTDPKSQFTAKIEMVDGEPVVVWSPKLSEVEAAKRIYTTYGKKALEGSHGGEPCTVEPWTPVETPTQGGWRFFKVGVEMR